VKTAKVTVKVTKDVVATAKIEARPDYFGRFANRSSYYLGSRWSFLAAITVIVAWGVTGPLFHYSDTWQLVINTGTTIVTFLMVFLIQNTQNRDAHAVHLKLDELIRATKGARNALVGLEDMSDEELDTLQREFEQLRDEVAQRKARRRARHGQLS